MEAYASLYASLQIQEKHLIPAGTVLLDNVIGNSADSVAEGVDELAGGEDNDVHSLRSKSYYPGALVELSMSATGEQSRVKTSSNSKGKSSPKTGQKRKRTNSWKVEAKPSPATSKQSPDWHQLARVYYLAIQAWLKL